MAIKIKVARANVTEGEKVHIQVVPGPGDTGSYQVHVHRDDRSDGEPIEDFGTNKVRETGPQTFEFDTSGRVAGTYTAQVIYGDNGTNVEAPFRVWARQEVDADVTLHRAASFPTKDQALWVAIRNRTNAIGFTRYQRFIDYVFGCDLKEQASLSERFLEATLTNKVGLPLEKLPGMPYEGIQLTLHGPYAYSVLKFATQVFLTLESGVVIRENEWSRVKIFDLNSEGLRINEPSLTLGDLANRLSQYLGGSRGSEVLPYLHRIVRSVLALNAAEEQEVLPYCYGVLQHRFTQPSLIELIWSYWHEEGMLAQTMNTIAMRFQNQRSAPNDPLAELEIDPLRPLNNIIWGYVQDEHNRLTVRRRAFEYDHHYGLKLLGRAVPELHTADSRSKFLEAFHNLLYRTAVFYREDADTTVIADAFPLLNALKDVHLLLAEGAHNQYGDLPWTARAEMLTQQWMLARPEMREFLRGRHMVPYQEPWMGAVDAMKKLQGWTDTTITHFNQLAVDGERLLLSIRFGDWSELNNTEEQARNWARYWKPELQRYLYGYLAATGVDLMADVTDNREAATRYLQPSMLLQRRLSAQARQPALAAPGFSAALAVKASGYAALPGVGQQRALKHETGE